MLDSGLEVVVTGVIIAGVVAAIPEDPSGGKAIDVIGVDAPGNRMLCGLTDAEDASLEYKFV
jgi:hypothetical protein